MTTFIGNSESRLPIQSAVPPPRHPPSPCNLNPADRTGPRSLLQPLSHTLLMEPVPTPQHCLPLSFLQLSHTHGAEGHIHPRDNFNNSSVDVEHVQVHHEAASCGLTLHIGPWQIDGSV